MLYCIENEESHQEAQNYSTVLREPLKGSKNQQGKYFKVKMYFLYLHVLFGTRPN